MVIFRELSYLSFVAKESQILELKSKGSHSLELSFYNSLISVRPKCFEFYRNVSDFAEISCIFTATLGLFGVSAETQNACFGHTLTHDWKT